MASSVSLAACNFFFFFFLILLPNLDLAISNIQQFSFLRLLVLTFYLLIVLTTNNIFNLILNSLTTKEHLTKLQTLQIFKKC